MRNTTSDFPLALYFESACPLCNAEMAALRARDVHERLRFVDVSTPGFVAPAGTTLPALLAAIHGRCADGRWVRGMEAMRLAYGAVGLGWLLAPTAWPLLRPAFDRTYAWFARHRHAMPRWFVRAKAGLLTAGAPPALARRARAAAAHARCTDSSCSH
jgi:predicted DCC family thiol-disulfide oxidoreductase YuxK